MSQPLPLLDPLLHQPVRTQLAAYLAGRGEATFSELKRVLMLTDGNLDSHLKKLVEAGYIDTTRDTGSGRTQTVFTLTDGGRKALAEYTARLAALLKIGDSPEVSLIRNNSAHT